MSRSPVTTMRNDPGRTVNIAAVVNREVGAAVRASGGIASQYFAQGRLHVVLAPLRARLTQVEQQRPDLLAVLAGDLGVPATLEDVVAEVEARASNLLDRRLERDLQPRYTFRLTPRRGARTTGSPDV